MSALDLRPVRRALYASLLLLSVLSHTTRAYSVEEICARRCLYHRGGVLCNCNARHFTGKRSGPSTDAAGYSSEAVRQGQQSSMFLRDSKNQNSLPAESGEIWGQPLSLSQDLGQEIRDLWDQTRMGGMLAGVQQLASDADVGDDQHEDSHKNRVTAEDSQETPVIIIEQDGSPQDRDQALFNPRSGVHGLDRDQALFNPRSGVHGLGREQALFNPSPGVHGQENSANDRLTSEQHLRELELLLQRALQGRR